MAHEYLPNNPVPYDWLYREVLKLQSDQVCDSVLQHLDDAIEGNLVEHPPEQESGFTFPVQAQLAQN